MGLDELDGLCIRIRLEMLLAAAWRTRVGLMQCLTCRVHLPTEELVPGKSLSWLSREKQLVPPRGILFPIPTGLLEMRSYRSFFSPYPFSCFPSTGIGNKNLRECSVKKMAYSLQSRVISAPTG